MMLRALSLIQPWATAILTMGKTVENRPWAPPKHMLGKRFAIHAGAKFDKNDAWSLQQHLRDVPASYPQRAILGTVELVGWFTNGTLHAEGAANIAECGWAAQSHWAVPGAVWWVLRAPQVLAEPIPMKGSLGLWRVPADAEARIIAALGPQGAST